MKNRGLEARAPKNHVGIVAEIAVKWFDSKSRRHFDAVMRPRHAWAARARLGEGGGGLSTASAKARWSATERRMIWASSIVGLAASRAASMMKSLTRTPSARWVARESGQPRSP